MFYEVTTITTIRAVTTITMTTIRAVTTLAAPTITRTKIYVYIKEPIYIYSNKVCRQINNGVLY